MKKIEQVARRHHFVPKFYLKVWQANDGKGLWLYQRDFNEQIKFYRRSTKAVGYVDDLYTLYPETNYSELNDPPDLIEKQFFSHLDDDAAKVHRKLLLSKLENLSSEDRIIWSLFLNSLIERSPSRIKKVETEDLVGTLQNELVQKLGNPDFLEKINLHAMCRNSIRYVLVNRIKGAPLIEALTRMKWVLVHVPIEGEHFVTSDRPVVINAGQGGEPIHCLSLPISPNKIFIAHSWSPEFDEEFLKILAAIHNIIIMEDAERYVVSSKKLDDGPHMKYSRAIQDFLNRPSRSAGDVT